MTMDLKRALAVATAAAVEAGTLIRTEFHRAGGPRHRGSDHADVDHEAEDLIRRHLLQAFPDTAYLGEETRRGGSSGSRACWHVDPNDGTSAFLQGWRGSAVSIALVVGGEPVLGVVYAPVAPDDSGDLISWAQGEPLRRNGAVVEREPLPERLRSEHIVLVSQSADRHAQANATCCAPARFRAVSSIAYRLALIAVGEGEAGCSLNGPVSWDYAAGHALLRAVGGELVDNTGQPLQYPSHRGGNVFGGSLAVARVLAGRPWATVFKTPPSPSKFEAKYPLVFPSHEWRASKSEVLPRAQGCLLGQLIGDALGQLVEFESPREIARRYPEGVRDLHDGGTWNTIAGQPTDDSELALLLARTLVRERRFDVEAVRQAYGDWIASRPFDVGSTTRQGIAGTPNLDSQANGSVMRVSPLAIFAHALPPVEVGRLARADSALTHPNRVCRDASAVFSVAIAHALRTRSAAADVHAFALEWARSEGLAASVVQTLQRSRTEPPPDFMRQQGWVLTALGNAFYQLLHAPSLEDGLVDTVGRGGDTDTNGAIAGALLGAVYGRAAVPLRWQRAILSCRPIRGHQPRPSPFWPVDVLLLAEALVAHGTRLEGALPQPEEDKVVRLGKRHEAETES